jgi:capsular exopolysaccharide synthesis family protein
VSSNIALSLAILGKKVALVGLDIRKPMLATYFNLNTKGHLTDYLAEPDIALDDVIIPSGEHKNLDLLPCGTIPPNPSELLQTDRLEELFAELRKRYDYIIVDTAPVALVSDTYLLDRIADMTIFVSRYKYTPSEMIDYINQVIDQKRMHNVACVLNGVKGNRMGYGYGYGYGTTEV